MMIFSLKAVGLNKNCKNETSSCLSLKVKGVKLGHQTISDSLCLGLVSGT